VRGREGGRGGREGGRDDQSESQPTRRPTVKQTIHSSLPPSLPSSLPYPDSTAGDISSSNSNGAGSSSSSRNSGTHSPIPIHRPCTPSNLSRRGGAGASFSTSPGAFYQVMTPPMNSPRGRCFPSLPPSLPPSLLLYLSWCFLPSDDSPHEQPMRYVLPLPPSVPPSLSFLPLEEGRGDSPRSLVPSFPPSLFLYLSWCPLSGHDPSHKQPNRYVLPLPPSLPPSLCHSLPVILSPISTHPSLPPPSLSPSPP